jgi:ADP-glucose pyrophosphorylase
MKTKDDVVMFIPACGQGTRMAGLGPKPFIHFNVPEGEAMALDRVMAQAPSWMDIEVALRKDMGYPRTQRGATVHFLDSTTGQADTIYQWLRRTRLRQYVLISNCDNRIDTASIERGLLQLDQHTACKGIIFTFIPPKKDDERWSYVRQNGNYKITEIVEKKPISSCAVAGVYLLNSFALRMSLFPEDIYLSETLARMDG